MNIGAVFFISLFLKSSFMPRFFMRILFNQNKKYTHRAVIEIEILTPANKQRKGQFEILDLFKDETWALMEGK